MQLGIRKIIAAICMNDLIITQSRLVQRADNFFIMQMNFCKTEASLSTSSVLLQIENCFYVPDLIEFGLSAADSTPRRKK